jgi:type IV secretory pathway TrbF-like protein
MSTVTMQELLVRDGRWPDVSGPKRSARQTDRYGGPRFSGIRLISDGTSTGTKVFDCSIGKVIPFVTKVDYRVGVGGVSEMDMTLIGAAADVVAKNVTTYIENVTALGDTCAQGRLRKL